MDDDRATKAVLTLLGGDPAGDALVFTPGAGAAAAGIAGLWDATTATLTLAAAGFAPVLLADLIGALADVTFDASAAGPTPRGGGLVVMPVIFLAWALVACATGWDALNMSPPMITS